MSEATEDGTEQFSTVFLSSDSPSHFPTILGLDIHSLFAIAQAVWRQVATRFTVDIDYSLVSAATGLPPSICEVAYSYLAYSWNGHLSTSSVAHSDDFPPSRAFLDALASSDAERDLLVHRVWQRSVAEYTTPARTDAAPPRARHFTPEDDARLAEALHAVGPDFEAVAELYFGNHRTSRALRERARASPALHACEPTPPVPHATQIATS
eukprot:gnl/Ergobibamus_cyprinoides/402.p1 GENE.gnl/Ergobibamus_cyprinoides/402~~gnl/Ergobibamus_cyprinoides/402.p1  ORF type:complete len:210 (-),score=15.86 gnl/Ergobibamus_cyprinoides/402:78-707(-)